MKTSCMHCVDPSCVSACPVSAMTKDPVTGIVGYDPEACIGCRYCVVACPFGIPKYQYDSPTGKIGKCELCRHRHKDGHYSACAEVCPTGATLFGQDLRQALLAEARCAALALPTGKRDHLSARKDRADLTRATRERSATISSMCMARRSTAAPRY
jgi:Fe-S-cluster-containing dehydrogenase component